MLPSLNKHWLLMTIAGVGLMTSLQVHAQGTPAQGTGTPRFDLRAQQDVNLDKDRADADEDRMHDQFVANIDQGEELENVDNKKRLEAFDKNIPDADYREAAKHQQERLHQNNL